MNYIREAEKYLYYYHDLYKSLEQINREIYRLIGKAGPHDITAVNYEQVKTNPSPGQDETINILFQIQKLLENREKTKQELEKIDELLQEISRDPGCELYGEILRKWYIEKMPKEEIAEKLGYSSRQSIYDLRAKAIRKFAVRLFGIGALEMI